MVSYSFNSHIEPSARLHDQDAATSTRVQGALSSNLVLHVDGWYHQQQPQQPPTAQLVSEVSNTARPDVFNRIASPSTIHSAGSAKRSADGLSSSAEDRTSKRTRDDDNGDSTFHHGGFRINDLLNPAAAAVAATATAQPLAAAKRLSVPGALARTRSADTKQYLNLLQLQLQKQQSEVAADPRRTFARAFSAPEKTEQPKADSAQGLVREALELDKLYGKLSFATETSHTLLVIFPTWCLIFLTFLARDMFSSA
ncbi:hypothetical protein FBU59_001424 [Linderina macrospora]|uniref:Uncharacterized protein n=1 Tax=Linderina macrospora TaxID=4868 RepID=A0ACC1JEA9_9FUNG|nr:hypothetical protein FBU59_001424 [Linderina macrospora]